MFAKVCSRTYAFVLAVVTSAGLFCLAMVWDTYASQPQLDLRTPAIVRNTLLKMDEVRDDLNGPHDHPKAEGDSPIVPPQAAHFLSKIKSDWVRTGLNTTISSEALINRILPRAISKELALKPSDSSLFVPWAATASMWDAQPTNETYPFSQLIVAPEAEGCQTGNWIPVLHSKPADFIERDKARRMMKHFSQGRASPVFVVGRPKVEKAEELERPIMIELMQEVERYKDLLIVEMEDTYASLAQKSVAMLEWFVWHCDKGNLLLKLDMDVVVNWPTFTPVLDSLNTLPHDRAIWMGRVATRMVVARDENARNFETGIEGRFYPPYCGGPAYLMNKKVALRVIEERSRRPRYFRNEDAMMGILLNNTEIKPLHTPKMLIFMRHPYLKNACGDIEETLLACDCDKWWTAHISVRNAEQNRAVAVNARQFCFDQAMSTPKKPIMNTDEGVKAAIAHMNSSSPDASVIQGLSSLPGVDLGLEDDDG